MKDSLLIAFSMNLSYQMSFNSISGATLFLELVAVDVSDNFNFKDNLFHVMHIEPADIDNVIIKVDMNMEEVGSLNRKQFTKKLEEYVENFTNALNEFFAKSNITKRIPAVQRVHFDGSFYICADLVHEARNVKFFPLGIHFADNMETLVDYVFEEE